MDYRLLAIDLDDTLLDAEHRISLYNKTMIKKAREQGVVVVLSTGRMYSSARPYYQELQLRSPMINYNGALVVDHQGTYLHHTPLSPSLSGEILTAMKEYSCHINLYVQDTLYVDRDGEERKLYEEISGIKGHLVDDLFPLLEGGPTKVVAISFQKDLLLEMEKDFMRHFHDRISLTPTRYGFLEAMAPGISKGQALSQVVRGYGLFPEQVVAFGDGRNDLSMVEYAGLGVAMENGDDRLKCKAHCIVPNGDGVGQIIQEYILSVKGDFS